MRGPIRSQSTPISRRTITVISTEAMMVLPIWVWVRERSSRTTAINGAIPNQPKKQIWKANHEKWKARICGVLKFNRRILLALLRISMGQASRLMGSDYGERVLQR
ncbi:hypothetical protein Q427_09795 [Halomonas sp. BC04]|nr:hypothetical protein Q427_09795 [Halomonas sp. BC04]